MYLSGAPLHVITLTLADEFRRAMGAEFPISFSAGVDRKNFANMVACGFVPVTTCTDLLKTGGYGRLPPYLDELREQMRQVGAKTLDDFILDSRGQRSAAGGDPARAGFLNTPLIVKETQADERYRAAHNQAAPKKIDSHLVLFDCITCDKCIPVCPNDANFAYHTGKICVKYRDVEVRPDGTVAAVGDEKEFALKQRDQIANFADYCNHCGNCDTFCPEYDGPYLMKPSFFGSRRSFDAGAPHDGFLLEGRRGTLALTARIDGRLFRLEQGPGSESYRYSDGAVELIVDSQHRLVRDTRFAAPIDPHRVDVGRILALQVLLEGITDDWRIHPVNAPLLAGR